MNTSQTMKTDDCSPPVLALLGRMLLSLALLALSAPAMAQDSGDEDAETEVGDAEAADGEGAEEAEPVDESAAEAEPEPVEAEPEPVAVPEPPSEEAEPVDESAAEAEPEPVEAEPESVAALEPSAEEPPGVESPEQQTGPVANLGIGRAIGDRSLTFTPYGFIAVNTRYNTGTPAPTQEAPVGAMVGSGINDELDTDGSFVITPRQSRLGFRLDFDADEDTNVIGRYEMDFFGYSENRGPGAATQTSLRLRHAAIDIGGERWRFVAGQWWSPVTPRLPTSYGHITVAVHTFSGALFARLPQLSVRNIAPISDTFSFQTQLALTRPHNGHGTGPFSRFDMPDPGNLGGLPYLQGRLALISEVFELGVAGHIGRERFLVCVGMDREPGYRYMEPLFEDDYVETWMGSVDLRLTSSGGAWLHAQAWMGANLTGLFGRQGVYVDRWREYEDIFADANLAGAVQDVEAIESFGGWAEVGMPLGDSDFTVVSSAGGDFGDKDDVDWLRVYRNIGFFGALLYNPLPFLDTSIEYYRTITYYKADLEYRLQEDYREDLDPLRGRDVPRRMREGHNDSISMNLRLRF